MKTLRAFLFIIVIASGAQQSHAQDPYFSLYAQNPLTINPAFAGSANNLRICSGYRNQWPSLTGTLISYAFSADYFNANLKSGLALSHSSESFDAVKLKRTALDWSFRIPLKRDVDGEPKAILQPAIEYTYGTGKIDTSKLTFSSIPFSKNPISYNDFSAGVMYYSKNILFGFSAFHLNQPDVGFDAESKLPIKYIAHAAGIIRLGEEEQQAYIQLNGILYVQQDYRNAQMGIKINKGPVVGGLEYKTDNGYVASIGFHQGRVTFFYAYDVTLSKLANTNAGSHELSFQFRLLNKQQDQRLSTIEYL